MTKAKKTTDFAVLDMAAVSALTKKQAISYIETTIGHITTLGKKLDDMIQTAAVLAINHLELHGDPGMMNKLIAGMPKGSRVVALNDWFDRFARADYDEDNKTWSYNRHKVTLLEDGMKKHWTACKPEQPFHAFDLQAAFAKLLTSAERAGNEKDATKKAQHKIDPVLLAQLQTMAPQD